MATKRSSVIAGVAALLVAGSIIVASLLYGSMMGLPVQTSQTSNISSAPSSGTATAMASTASSQSTVSSVSGPSQGTLSILLTDPPNVPQGVTKVYVTYSNLQVHVAEAGNDSGWNDVQAHGTIELMGTVNVSQTLSSVKITSGDYNLIRFNISSAQVTYNGKNYTAFVPSSRLLVPILGGIEVNASKPSATIIDISPTVLNIGSTSNPEFIIRPTAKALPVPSSQVSERMEHPGFRLNLRGKAWWKDLQQRFTANARITAATLSSDSLTLTVKNTGNVTTALRLVMVAPLAGAVNDGHEHQMPSTFFNSAVFVVEKNGTLIPLSTFVKSLVSAGKAERLNNHQLVEQLFADTGINVTSGASANLTYTGQINFGLQLLQNVKTTSVVSGQQYLVTVLGQDALASLVVVAS